MKEITAETITVRVRSVEVKTGEFALTYDPATKEMVGRKDRLITGSEKTNVRVRVPERYLLFVGTKEEIEGKIATETLVERRSSGGVKGIK